MLDRGGQDIKLEVKTALITNVDRELDTPDIIIKYNLITYKYYM